MKIKEINQRCINNVCGGTLFCFCRIIYDIVYEELKNIKNCEKICCKQHDADKFEIISEDKNSGKAHTVKIYYCPKYYQKALKIVNPALTLVK